MVLPSTNPSLKSLATSRSSYYVAFEECLPYDVEFAIVRVIERELELFKKLEIQRESITYNIEFNLLSCFKAIDINDMSFIDQAAMYDFLRSNGKIAYQDELDAIFRRCDKDSDFRISYLEFVDAVMPNTSTYRPHYYSPSYYEHLLRSEPRALRASYASPSRLTDSQYRSGRHYNTSPKRQSYSPLRNRSFSPRASYNAAAAISSDIPRRGLTSTPNKERNAERMTPYASYSSPYRSKSPAPRDMYNEEKSPYSSPIRDKEVTFSHKPQSSLLPKKLDYLVPEDLDITPTKKQPLSPREQRSPREQLSPREQRSPMKGNEEEELAKSFKEQITIDKDLENLRQDLALRSDFNLIDSFRIFDIDGKGYVTASELEEGFNLYGVFPTKDEVYLMMRRYDKNASGKLKYSDFCEMMTPKQSEFASLLNNRLPYNNDETFSRTSIFSSETKYKFTRALRLLVDSEASAEILRQRLAKRPLFSIHEGFSAVDKDGKGFVTKEEFRELLEQHRFWTTEKELAMLVDRYDKNKDGRVTYSDVYL